MIKANPTQVLAGFLWHKDNMLPLEVIQGSIHKGFEIDQRVLLKYLMKFQSWIYDWQQQQSIESTATNEIPSESNQKDSIKEALKAFGDFCEAIHEQQKQRIATLEQRIEQNNKRITDLKIENNNLQVRLKDASRDDDDGGHDPTYG